MYDPDDDLTPAVLADTDAEALAAAARYLARHGHDRRAEQWHIDRPNSAISTAAAIEYAARRIDTRDTVTEHALDTFAWHLAGRGIAGIHDDPRHVIATWEHNHRDTPPEVYLNTVTAELHLAAALATHRITELAGAAASNPQRPAPQPRRNQGEP
jgi:hypothetical protein